MKIIPRFCLFCIFILILSACTPRSSLPASLSQQQENTCAISLSTPTPAYTPTRDPSSTATLTTTPTDLAVTGQVILTLQRDTNCRSGPGTVYPVVTVFHTGDQVDVIGRYYFEHYYSVSTTVGTSNTCWLWDDSSSLTGVAINLPIVTAAPVPSPSITPTSTTAPADFNLGIPWFDQCEIDAVNYYIPQFEITNTGTIHFQSIRAVLTNETTLDTFVYEFDYFRGSMNCAIDNDGESTQLLAGDSTAMVLRGNRMLQENPAGTKFSLKVTLFAKNKQQGISVTREIFFTP